jgi:hypothetical protein
MSLLLVEVLIRPLEGDADAEVSLDVAVVP